MLLFASNLLPGQAGAAPVPTKPGKTGTASPALAAEVTTLPPAAPAKLGSQNHPQEQSSGTPAEPVPVPEVIVFAAPAPEGIRETIDLLKLLNSQATHPTKELVVREPKRQREGVREEPTNAAVLPPAIQKA